TADHVAEQRTQMVGELICQPTRAALLESGAVDRSPLDLDRFANPSAQRGALVAIGAQRTQAAGQQATRGVLGVKQHAQRKQVVGQSLQRVVAIASHLEAPQRPRQLPLARTAARYEVVEGTKLVLLLGPDQECPGPLRARSERQRTPRSIAGPGPPQHT